MKKILKFIFCILCFLALSLDINAECKDKEINDFIEDLDIVFFAPRKEEDFSKKYLDSLGESPDAGFSYYFIFSKEDYDSKTKVSDLFEIEAIDGKGVPGVWEYQDAIEKYGVGGYNGVDEEIYTLRIKAKTGTCKGQILKEKSYTVPRFNVYTQTKYCEDYPDHELCQPYTNKTENMNDADFGRAMHAYEVSLDENRITLKKLILKYYMYVLCAVVPFIVVSIYYKRRIKHLIQIKNQEEERHIIRRNASIFLICFLLFMPTLNAASECKYVTEIKRRTIAIPGFKISIEHCGWGDKDDLDFKGDDYTSYYTNLGIQNAIDWGLEKVNTQIRDCYGEEHWLGEIERCVMKEDGGLGVVHVKATKKIKGTDTGEACTVKEDSYTKRDCTANETEEGKTECYDKCEGCNKIPGLKCWGGSCVKNATSCESKEFEASYEQDYDGAKAAGATTLISDSDACTKAEKEAKEKCEKQTASGTKECVNNIKCEQLAYVKCPKYPCHRTSVKIDPTIDIIEIDDETSYCVNPGATISDKYQAVEIDANKCVNGNSSVDCGYINILLEAQYFNKVVQKGKAYQIPQQVINVAMRLWGAYTNQGGYKGAGIGLFSGKNCHADSNQYGIRPGEPCLDMVFLDPTAPAGKIVPKDDLNVYVATMRYMLANPTRVTNRRVNPETLEEVDISQAPGIFTGLECITSSGIMCAELDGSGMEKNDIKYALALFYNTRNGNKHYMEHLNAVFGDVSARPTEIKISSQSTVQDLAENETIYEEAGCIKDENDKCKVSKTLISLEFDEEITNKSELINCTDILKKQKEGKTLTEYESKIVNYCNIEVKEVRAYNPDGSYTKYVNDPRGDYYEECNADDTCHGGRHAFSGAIGSISHCQKSTCVVDTKIYADCEYDIKKITTYLKYRETTSVHGFRKYISCTAGNPRQTSGMESQFLYSIIPYNKEEISYSDETIEEYNVIPDCKRDDPSRCTDLTVKESSKKCSDPNISDLSKYQNPNGSHVYSTSIHDPSLSCIVNASNADKTSYDYSDYFGVNTDLCRIYCSDEAHFYLADKVVIYSGLSFKYDIEYGKYKKNTSSKALTSMVEMRRNCVSEIYFDYNQFDKSLATLANKYGFTSTSQLEGYNNWYKTEKGYDGNNWVTLYNAVYDRVVSYESKRNEILNKLIYDLYNCNLYSSGIPVDKPRDNTTGVVFTEVVKPRFEEKGNYAFEDCTLNSNENTCINYLGVTYNGGAAYAKDSKAVTSVGGVKEVGDAVDTIQFKHTMDLNPDTKATISNVRYCKGKGCFDYRQYRKEDQDDNIKNGEYTLPKDRVNDNNPDVYALSQRPIDVQAFNSSEPQRNEYTTQTKRFIEYEGTNPLTRRIRYIKSNKDESSITIPTNDYAYFTVSTKIGFYNNSDFQVEAYTGNVYDVTEGSPYAEAKVDGSRKRDFRTNLNSGSDSGLYPTAAITNECTALKNSKTGEPYYECKIENHFGEINTFHRNFGKVTANGLNSRMLDPFYTAINNAMKTTFTCSYITKNAFDNDTQAVYRNVDLKNFFPNGRTPGKNWNTLAAKSYYKNIESTVKTYGETYYYNKTLEYSYTLTRDAIMKIKDDNARIKSYTNDNIDIGTIKNIDSKGRYVDLRTSFIDLLESNTNSYGIINNRQGQKRGVSTKTDEDKEDKG